MRWPNESEEYRRARDELLQAEIELRRREEAVAAKRRALPLAGRLKEDWSHESRLNPGAPKPAETGRRFSQSQDRRFESFTTHSENACTRAFFV
jgi:hypothetical protein